ncbi:MAG: Omp28-related outer membrane protein [Clostridia bacterium]|nr:Omp28-related outer membrane protein [Clostridia bacterium]
MKKIFTLLAALVLSLTIANAQIIGKNAIKKSPVELQKYQGVAPEASPKLSKANSKPQRISLDNDEHLIGYYTTDDIPAATYGSYGFPNNTGQLKAGAIFEDDVFHNYYGGQITKVRFALRGEVDIANVEIYEVDPDTYAIDNTPISHTDFTGTPTVGWNDVTLSTPVTIEKDKYYLISFEYTQIPEDSTTAAHPLITDTGLDVDINPYYGFLVYGYWPSYNATDWNAFVTYGSLCIQAVVKGGGDVADMALKNFFVDKYGKAGEDIDYSFNMRNDGQNIPSTYEISVSIDGVVQETLSTPVPLTSEYQTYNGTITLPADISTGDHKIMVHVAKINGNEPTQYTEDDTLETSFNVYEGSASVSRQMYLIEEYTSTLCTYCPLGHAVLDKLQENHPNRYALVAIHSEGMGADPMFISDKRTEYLEYYADRYGTLPAASFNRYLYNDADLNADETVAIGIAYDTKYTEEVANDIYNLVHSTYSKIPVFAAVCIESHYNSDTRELSIKVYGDGVSNAKDYLADNRLTVYLTEDGLVYTQLNQGTYDKNYVHNNVLRQIVNDNDFGLGDEIGWTSESSYENNFTVTLDSSWNADNMHIVALISKDLAHWEDDALGGHWYYNDYDEMFVNNANMVKLGETTGIKSVSFTDSNVVEVSRYTIDGRQISSPVKGLNIVKMSDGTARKVIVK